MDCLGSLGWEAYCLGSPEREGCLGSPEREDCLGSPEREGCLGSLG